MINAWFNTLPETAVRRQIYVVMALIMRTAADLEEVEKSPCRVKGVSRTKSPKKAVQHWADLRFLVQTANDVQMEALLWVLAGTGMRVGEALALDWQDVDYGNGTISVSKHLTRFGLEDGYKAHTDKERTMVDFPRL